MTGRLGGLAADELARAVAADAGFAFGAAEAAGPLLLGLASDGPVTARALLEPVLQATGLAVRDGGTGLEIVRPRLPVAVTLPETELIEASPRLSRRRPDATGTPAALALGYADRMTDYRGASIIVARAGAVGLEAADSGLVLEAAGARLAAERLLRSRAGARDAVELALPPQFAALEVGDTLLVGEAAEPLVITELRDGLVRRVRAETLPAEVAVSITGEVRGQGGSVAAPAAAPEIAAMLLPPDPARPELLRLALAAYAQPWPGRIDIQHAGTGAALARLSRAASLGTMASALAPGPIHCWDNSGVTVSLSSGHVADIEELAALDGGNRLAVETDEGRWEVLGFAGASLVAPDNYRLTRLLRGLGGSDAVMGPAAIGNRVVLLDSRVALIDVAPEWLGGTLSLRAYAGAGDAVGTAFEVAIGLDGLLPLPPGHLSARRGAGGVVALSWIRRSRADTGNWALLEVPLEAAEGYAVEILDGAMPVRSLDVVSPAAIYPAAEQLADFGSLPAAFDWRVRQLSPAYGAGHTAEGTFNA